MTSRDLDYIETRLLAPAVELSDAIERLHRVGEHAHADRLLNALGKLVDECRDVRRTLVDAQKEARMT